ncbi:heat-inducible transcription repressor HrcA [Actinomycetaceae bacterium WB03_NA08]|uniref:Heat-inducible transcription repressor HrcA n=1 Tax=Scrofimicrobium canadense TaxID=2652290 RepID=A0A6N7VQ40_9ACTO|nr:heat-inducible transcriptional repressor HrcA [Scrofimicrobium canadense]MSS83869.1 heat-inducible transcription repressor HrcA [Scrofimicrobium canadense]
MTEPKMRQLDVLRAVVSQYVATGEPVSSKAVANAHPLDVSSATIRNDMGVLEDAGFIYQPHTSAGRVPTEAGYRRFVDRLTEVRPLSLPQRQAIERFLSESVDFEDTIGRTVRLLAQLTGSAAVVEYALPGIGRETLRRLDIVDLDSHRILVVAITSLGRVVETTLTLDTEVTADFVERLREALGERLVNLDSDEIADAAADAAESFVEAEREIATEVALACGRLAQRERPMRMMASGLSNLARSGSDFMDVSEVLDTIEEQVVLLRLLAEVHTGPLQVSIGAENQSEALSQASVISASYQGEARVGVVGPTRMDYPGSLAAVEAVSRYLARLIERG